MKDLLKWIGCLLKRRHNMKYFRARMLEPKQYVGHGYGSMAKCEHCYRLVFFPFKNKQEYFDFKKWNKKA